jgi:beta propeller repeat protein
LREGLQKKGVFLIVLAALALLALPVLAAAVSDWTTSVVVSNPSDQVNPVVSGSTVAWQDYRNQSSGCPTADNCLPADIFARTMPAGAEQKLTSTPNGLDPAIDGSLVVWHNWSTGKIVMDDLSTGNQQNASTATGTIQQVTPAVSGNRIVWVDYRNSAYYGDIYMRDLSQPADQPVSVASTSTSIPNAKKDKRNPAIDGNIVVWEDWRNAYEDSGGWWHNPDIYMKNLSTGVEQPVCTNTSDQYSPAVSGNRIVWQDYRNGKWDIYMLDLSTGAETNLTSGNPDNATSPSISGNFVAWKDKTAAGAENIEVKNLLTGAVTPLTSGTASHKLPSASGSNFVWMDSSAGNWDIAIANDTVPPVVSAVSPAGPLTTTAATVSAALTDGGSGVDASSVAVTLDGAALPGCSVSTSSVSCPVSGLSQGPHSIGVTVKDLVGNSGSGLSTFTVDSLAPVISAASPSGLLASFSGISAGYSDSGSGIDPASAQVTLDGAVISGCNATASSVSCQPAGVADGHHNYSISVMDMYGNAAAGSGSFDLDTTPPVIDPVSATVTPGSGNAVIDAGLSDPAPGSGIDTGAVSVELDGAAMGGCTITSSHVSCAATGLAYGPHAVSVSAADVAGNSAVATASFTVNDTVAPVVTPASPIGTVSGPTTTITAAYDDAAPSSGINQASVAVQLDGSALAGCSVSASQVSCLTGNLMDGAHSVRILASDNAGNRGESDWSFSVKPGAPALSNLTPPAGATINNVTPLISAGYFDGGGIDQASVRIYVDSVDVTPQAAVAATSVSYQPSKSALLRDGKHVARVVVADMQGNVTDQSWEFTVTSPSISLTLGNVYWASLSNYQAGMLTVNYRIDNTGTSFCNAGQVTVAYASNAVRAYGPLPVSLGNLAPAASVSYDFLYLVPPDVGQFVTMSYSNCQDDGANLFWFPGAPPTS